MAETLRELTARYPDLERFEKKIGELVAKNYFKKGINIFINRTPGCLDLIGGNDDYTGGLVFETTIREATLAAIQPCTDYKVIFHNLALKSSDWKDKIEDLQNRIAVPVVEFAISALGRRIWNGDT